jgi:hypothetical protein
MKKIYFLLFSFLLLARFVALSQCTYTSSFGTVTINPVGTISTISTCSFAGEFSTISGAVAGQTLQFTSSVATDFITIRSGSSSGPVVAFGATPLVFANTFTGTLFAHWSADAVCATQSACRTTTVQCTNCTAPPPVNDLCTGALPIACAQTITGNTATGATVDAVATCVTTLNSAPGVWYTFAGDGSITTLSLCGSSYDTKIGVFSGTCAALTCVTGNDDFASCGLQSQVTFQTTTGTDYYILVTGFGTAAGAFTLNRSCIFPCIGTPSSGTISGPGATVCSGSSTTLTLTGFTAGSGISLQWKSSATPGGPYTPIAGGTNSTYTFTANTTAYYICTVNCSFSGLSSNTAEFVVNVDKPVHTTVIATPAAVCAPGAIVITATAAGSSAAGNYTHTLTGPGTIGAAVVSGTNNSNVSFSVTAIPAGTQTYVLTTTDAIGCSVVSNAIVTVNPIPVIIFAQTPAAICNGQVQQITATVVPPVPQLVTGGGSITINTSGIANPYSSNLIVGGLPASGVSIKSVTINGVSHTFPSDIDMLLQSPFGTNVILMSDAGGSTAISGRSITFDDAAAATVPSPIVNGTFRPTNTAGPDNFPAPGPGSITQVAPTLASFGAGDYNGVWKLFVVDDATGDGGAITDWSITFNIPVPVSYSPITNLFTNSGATIAYDGTPTLASVYAKPAATSTYTATAIRNGCTGTANVTVTVNQLPAITTQPTPATQTVCTGSNVTYTVAATGAGLIYQWKRNGVALVNGLQLHGTTVSGATTNSLTLGIVSLPDAGNYTVDVSGTCTPAVTSTAVALVIATPPTITTQPANVTACIGGNASFTVAAAGSPTPTIYQWQVSTTAVPAFTNITVGSFATPTLVVNNVTAAMSGNKYRVIVTNSCGQSVISNGSATLTVNALPVVTATALPGRICLSDGPIPLAGSPVGGSWSGIGVSGTNFVPAATAVGTYTLTYTYTNNLGCVATATTTAVVFDCPERIRLLSNNAVILFPNPNNGAFSIKVNSVLYNYLNMKVYNTSGNLVNTRNYTGLVYGQVIPVDLTHLPSGNYMVRFFYDDGIRTSEKVFPVVIGRQ